ncbi:uncharacterized protein LOC128336810 isoform X1 [Hemicordylus capensis]|uniref:uncharacterized protein LOC128336810 isoform X1 n=1 Tax=Hemicordylus capensis TaxID=884348 RepID=UPI002302EF7E|nr:uncharacterized protein LOC128336810 isoform X1 [Hemicordylus capensis]
MSPPPGPPLLLPYIGLPSQTSSHHWPPHISLSRPLPSPTYLSKLYEFTASDEMPRTVAFHPSQQIFACGFDTGVVRTISLAASKLLEEHKQHHDSITGLIFSPDGNFMYSCCARGTLALYNCAVQKSHIVRVLANVVVQDADHGPDALSISADGHLLAFVGPSEYIVTLMDARSLDEWPYRQSRKKCDCNIRSKEFCNRMQVLRLVTKEKLLVLIFKVFIFCKWYPALCLPAWQPFALGIKAQSSTWALGCRRRSCSTACCRNRLWRRSPCLTLPRR